jgi:hypothetical protein
MGLDVKVGSFVVPTSTGLQAITGLGFEPKALIFWSAAEAAASDSGESCQFVGLATGPAEEGIVGFCSADGAAASETRRWDGDDSCLAWFTPAGSKVAEAELDSLDADGFTVNWLTAPGTANLVVNFLALGGADISHAKVAEELVPNSTGNQAYTGYGFQPDALLIVSAADPLGTGLISRFHEIFSIGAATGPSARWAAATADKNGLATSFADRKYTDQELVQAMHNRTEYAEADLVSLDADGFTLDWTVAPAAAGDMFVLAIKGDINIAVGQETTNISTGTKATSGLGFAPSAALFVFSHAPSVDTVANGGKISIGGADASSQRANAQTSKNAAATTETHRWQDEDSVLLAYDEDSQALEVEAALDSFDADGFTLDYGTADGNARTFGYLAFGPYVPPVGDTVGSQLVRGIHR